MAANVLFFVAPNFYYSKGILLNTLFGGSLLVSLLLVFITFRLKFCEVSRWAAIAELIFALMALFIHDDGVYNISLQLGVGALAMLATFRHYIKKFPLCSLSLLVSFFSNLFIAKGDCRKGVEKFEQSLQNTIEKKYHETKR